MFLVSDTDMIPLVAADTTRYESLEPHLSTMFPAASRLVVDHTTHCALGFESSNCGALPFVEAIEPLSGEGMQVNVMVDALVAATVPRDVAVSYVVPLHFVRNLLTI